MLLQTAYYKTKRTGNCNQSSATVLLSHSLSTWRCINSKYQTISQKVWFADIDGGASSDVLVFRAKEGHSPSFLYAVLLQDSFFDYVMQGAKGSKMPRGDKEQILRYEMPTLSCSEESIGTFFLNLDQKSDSMSR